nr:nucleoside recognition domain-containing protein [Natroniella acetigena]
MKELLEEVWKASADQTQFNEQVSVTEDERWQAVGRIVEEVQEVEHRHPTFLEKLGDLAVKPVTGIPIACLVLLIALVIVVGGGKGLRAVFFLPFVDNIVVPFFRSIVSIFITEGLLFNVLVGEYGALVKGIEWPFALVLPYVFLFYIVLSFLEDSGYLPRVAVLLDSTLRKLGIQGGNIVPLIMGYGCAIPAILGTRANTSPKERLVTSSLVVLAVPCSAQAGAFVALLGDHSILALVLVYLISLAGLLLAGVILNKVIPGKSDPMLLEIPHLLLPDREALFKKIWLRTKSFMIEAEMPILLGVGFAALLVEAGLLESINSYLAPLTTGWLGLPTEATMGLMLGIIRRELAVLPLLELDLSTLQIVVGSVVALFYIPCISALGVLIKEFGVKIAITIGFVTTFIAIFAGGLINQVVSFIGILL